MKNLLVMEINYIRVDTDAIALKDRVACFLNKVRLPARHAFFSDSSIFLIWEYEIHENLEAWNFGHTFQEVVFLREAQACRHLLDKSATSLFITESAFDFCRFGAPFLSKGISAEVVQQEECYRNIEQLPGNGYQEWEDKPEVKFSHREVIQKILKSKMELVRNLCCQKSAEEASIPVLRALYDQISALIIAIDFEMSPSMFHQYESLCDFLSRYE